MNSISITYDLKWTLKEDNNYQWSTCGKLFNVKTGRLINKILLGYSLGYYINGRFVTLKNLRKNLVIIKPAICPF